MTRHTHSRNAETFGRITPEARGLDGPAPRSEAAFFRQIIESCPTPMLVLQTAGTDQPIVYANPAFERLFGLSRKEIVGRDWRVFLSGHAFARHERALPPTMRTDPTVKETMVAIRRDGGLLYLEVRLSPVCDAAGAITRHVAVLRDVTIERRMRETLEHRACYDPLTGLANRYLLRDRFEHAAAQAKRRGTVYTLTLIDLDGFKRVNDRFGHIAGDEVLVFIGAQLMALVRGEDTVARLGGDEFALLLMDADPQSTRSIVDRLCEPLASFGPSGLDPIGLSCSAGVALFPDDATTLQGLLRAADKRLYAAKTQKAHSRPGTDCRGWTEAVHLAVPPC